MKTSTIDWLVFLIKHFPTDRACIGNSEFNASHAPTGDAYRRGLVDVWKEDSVTWTKLTGKGQRLATIFDAIKSS